MRTLIWVDMPVDTFSHVQGLMKLNTCLLGDMRYEENVMIRFVYYAILCFFLFEKSDRKIESVFYIYQPFALYDLYQGV